MLAMIGFGISIAIFVANVQAFSFAPAVQPDVLERIVFASSFTDADARYLQTSLSWLREYLPEWYAYVADAKPFIFALDEELEWHGIVSYAECCYDRAAGGITFGEHLGEWTIGEVADIPGFQAQQIQFLSVLVHEVTHIRDVREGRISQPANSRICIAAEQSAKTQELEFARALTRVQISGDANARANYRDIVDKHLDITQENLDDISWKIVCVLMYDE